MYDLDRIRDHGYLRRFEFHAELGSTNDLAIERLAAGDVELPFLVLTARQTAGRGRGANRWWASEGALTFSLAVAANALRLAPARWPQVSLAVGLAVHDVLSMHAPETAPRLKWPNDVYVEGRKVCGILVEMPPVRPEPIVIGVGLNVNNAFASAPSELREKATSLSEAAGRIFDRTDVLLSLVERIAAQLTLLADDNPCLAERWLPACLLEGSTVEIESAGRPIVGRCLGIDADGALVLDTAEGRQRIFSGVVVRYE